MTLFAVAQNSPFGMKMETDNQSLKFFWSDTEKDLDVLGDKEVPRIIAGDPII